MSTAITAPPSYASVETLLDTQFWRSEFPKLSIGKRLTPKLPKIETPSAVSFAEIDSRMRSEGYFDGRDDRIQYLTSLLGDAAAHCVQLQIPPTFIFVFDEAWECFYRLHPLLSHLLGENYKVMPDFWTWYINPQKHESGWTPHRDKGKYSLAADGSPLSLTVWIPLSDATPMNSCIYLLPADRDPVYNTEKEKQWQVSLADVRALPAKPGDFFCWNQAVLHWGSRSSPFAKTPRMSIALEFQRGDVTPFNQPLLEPLANLDFIFRLKLIGKQILQYKHMYKLSDDMAELAKRLLE